MNRAQWITLRVGIATLIATGLMPPWTVTAYHQPYESQDPRTEQVVETRVYHPITSRPGGYTDEGYVRFPDGIDWLRLVVEWFVVVLITAGLMYAFRKMDDPGNSGEGGSPSDLPEPDPDPSIDKRVAVPH